MPSFLPVTTNPKAIYPGQSITLVLNAATTDTNVTSTLQVAIGSDPQGSYRLTMVNTTNQTATVQVAPNDPVLPTPAAAAYQPYQDEGTAITVPASKSVSFNCFGPWVNCTFTTAPSSGSLILSR